MPWSLVGVSDEARKAVRAAAAESGQTIGAWLNDRILEAARSNGTDPAPIDLSEPGIAAELPGILRRMSTSLNATRDFTDHEIESYRIAIDVLRARIDALETAENRE